ncbi:MAG: hypothetical protein C0404_13255 [Verrucomicrobia bacterium]|nr:hypothetical protein [Verrucomicrobiota bacterium]
METMMKPVYPIRGLMLDLGRITEKKSYYVSLLPWLAEWGYNLVHLHLADDQRCALRFPSRPELATPGAFTADEMRNFVELAGGYGISVMPEIEALGHSQFITERKEYRHLAEPLPDKFGYNALCPSLTETREILADLLRDSAQIFDYPVIHVGLDEVRFGDCPVCRKKFGKIADWQRFAEHAAWVHAEVRKLNKQPAMWADHVVKQLSMLDRFKKDVLMYYWDYTIEYRVGKVQSLIDAGFKVMSCPSALCSTARILPNSTISLKNLRNSTGRSRHQVARGVVGMVNTLWCPWRYLPGAVDYGMAFGAHVATVEEEDPGFAERFVRRFYGVSNARPLAAAILELHDLSPDKNTHDRIVYGYDGLETLFNREDRRECGILAKRVAGILSIMRKFTAKVRRNKDRYGDLVLSAEALLAMARFGAAGRKKSAVKGARALYRRAELAWNRDRQAGDNLRFGGWHHGHDALLRALKSYC